MTEPMNPSDKSFFKFVANREYFEYEGKTYRKIMPLKLTGLIDKANAICVCDNGYYLRWFDDDTKVVVEMGKGI